MYEQYQKNLKGFPNLVAALSIYDATLHRRFAEQSN